MAANVGNKLQSKFIYYVKNVIFSAGAERFLIHLWLLWAAHFIFSNLFGLNWMVFNEFHWKSWTAFSFRLFFLHLPLLSFFLLYVFSDVWWQWNPCRVTSPLWRLFSLFKGRPLTEPDGSCLLALFNALPPTEGTKGGLLLPAIPLPFQPPLDLSVLRLDIIFYCPVVRKWPFGLD